MKKIVFSYAVSLEFTPQVHYKSLIQSSSQFGLLLRHLERAEGLSGLLYPVLLKT